MEKFWWKIFDGNCWWKILEEMSYLISLNPLLFKNIAVGEFKTKNKDSLLQLLAHHLSKQHYNRLANLKNLKDAIKTPKYPLFRPKSQNFEKSQQPRSPPCGLSDGGG